MMPRNPPESFKEGKKSMIDEWKEVDRIGEGDPRHIFVNVNLTSHKEELYVQLLNKYKDARIFTGL